MPLNRIIAGISVATLLAVGFTSESRSYSTFARGARTSKGADFAVAPQYGSTHVYVAPQDFDRFVASVISTFGGTAGKQGIFTVTPTPSSTMSQLAIRIWIQDADSLSVWAGAHGLSGHRRR